MLEAGKPPLSFSVTRANRVLSLIVLGINLGKTTPETRGLKKEAAYADHIFYRFRVTYKSLC